MSLCSLSYDNRIEVCTLYKHLCRFRAYSRLQAAVYSAHAHCLSGIANHCFSSVECSLHSVQCREFRSLRQSLDLNSIAFNLVQIKSMQRLTYFHQNEIGCIYDIVYRTNADNPQTVRQPFRRVRNLHSAYRYSRITLA